jgi:serralysin
MHGNDTIIGGGGGDTLTGGPGADTFKYLAFSDSRSSSGIDRITDFSAASGDKLDLSALKGTDGKVATLQTAYNASFSGLQAVPRV